MRRFESFNLVKSVETRPEDNQLKYQLQSLMVLFYEKDTGNETTFFPLEHRVHGTDLLTNQTNKQNKKGSTTIVV